MCFYSHHVQHVQGSGDDKHDEVGGGLLDTGKGHHLDLVHARRQRSHKDRPPHEIDASCTTRKEFGERNSQHG